MAVVLVKQKMLPCASKKGQEPFQTHSCKAEEFLFLPSCCVTLQLAKPKVLQGISWAFS